MQSAARGPSTATIGWASRCLAWRSTGEIEPFLPPKLQIGKIGNRPRFRKQEIAKPWSVPYFSTQECVQPTRHQATWRARTQWPHHRREPRVQSQQLIEVRKSPWRRDCRANANRNRRIYGERSEREMRPSLRHCYAGTFYLSKYSNSATLSFASSKSLASR